MYINVGIIPDEDTTIRAITDGVVAVHIEAGASHFTIHAHSVDVCDRLIAAFTEARAALVAQSELDRPLMDSGLVV